MDLNGAEIHKVRGHKWALVYFGLHFYRSGSCFVPRGGKSRAEERIVPSRRGGLC